LPEAGAQWDLLQTHMREIQAVMALFYISIMAITYVHQNSQIYTLTKVSFSVHKLCTEN
jgi:hypothetical protein